MKPITAEQAINQLNILAKDRASEAGGNVETEYTTAYRILRDFIETARPLSHGGGGGGGGGYSITVVPGGGGGREIGNGISHSGVVGPPGVSANVGYFGHSGNVGIAGGPDLVPPGAQPGIVMLDTEQKHGKAFGVTCNKCGHKNIIYMKTI